MTTNNSSSPTDSLTEESGVDESVTSTVTASTIEGVQEEVTVGASDNERSALSNENIDGVSSTTDNTNSSRNIDELIRSISSPESDEDTRQHMQQLLNKIDDALRPYRSRTSASSTRKTSTEPGQSTINRPANTLKRTSGQIGSMSTQSTAGPAPKIPRPAGSMREAGGKSDDKKSVPNESTQRAVEEGSTSMVATSSSTTSTGTVTFVKPSPPNSSSTFRAMPVQSSAGTVQKRKTPANFTRMVPMQMVSQSTPSTSKAGANVESEISRPAHMPRKRYNPRVNVVDRHDLELRSKKTRKPQSWLARRRRLAQILQRNLSAYRNRARISQMSRSMLPADQSRPSTSQMSRSVLPADQSRPSTSQMSRSMLPADQSRPSTSDMFVEKDNSGTEAPSKKSKQSPERKSD